MSDPRLPQRKSPRLPGYDYAQSGAYFVTICTDNRAYLFGEIVDGKMLLNGYGEIAQTCWQEIPDHHPNVDLDLYVVMPNHVHGIIFIREEGWRSGDNASRPYRAPTPSDPEITPNAHVDHNVGTAYMPSAVRVPLPPKHETQC